MIWAANQKLFALNESLKLGHKVFPWRSFDVIWSLIIVHQSRARYVTRQYTRMYCILTFFLMCEDDVKDKKKKKMKQNKWRKRKKNDEKEKFYS